ncbi:transcriptional regulator [Sphingomonas spermidinifaciens]|uniref:Transcriptional regulator n=1 Tax=Sphingomonas spermidinifaciens TaxID=1141889 RepID=A0A2A4B5Y4_9SPHN|nr:cupin-like domain-containing protein [Sphingomonas spermidinifaciens]PCD03054.1 transcriptional regulator [Sphingomonas spermidinifaciens]
MTQIFDDGARSTFDALYPETAGKLTHGLVGHKLFELESLVALAQRMRPVDVEQNLADLPIGVDPDAVRDNGLSFADTIRSIEENGSWMVLKFVEQDPAYKALMDEVLDEIAPLAAPSTGPMLKREAFIFVSSPKAVTPFHFDPEHNILLQLRGSKTMTVFDPADHDVVKPEAHEAFHRGAHRNLPFRDEIKDRGQPITIAPGEAIYVPVKAPHWVQNGPATSVSFSITWRSGWSYREQYAHNLNAMLRDVGLSPSAPKRYPAQNLAKSTAYRAIAKARRVAGIDKPG